MDAELRQIEARCGEALESLNLPDLFTCEDLLNAISEKTNQEIVVRAADLSGSMPFGLAVQTATMTTILYPRNTTRLHQRHIAIHEGFHVMAHLPASDDEDPALEHGLEATIRRLIPDLHPDLEARVRARTNYARTQELEAEGFATMVQARMRRARLPEQRFNGEFPAGLQALFDVPTPRSGVPSP